MSSRSHIHYGSLAEVERDRLAKLEAETKQKLESLRAATKGGAPAASAPAAPEPETIELSGSSQQAIARQQELKDTLAKRKRAREVPRARKPPAPLPRPSPRERLRDVLAAAIDLGEPGDELRGAQTMLDGPSKAAALSHEAARPAEWQAEKQKEEFYTEGSQALRAARIWVCKDSMRRAAARLADERAAVEARCADVTGFERDNALLASKLSGVQNQLSNFGDERPVSYCAFAPGGGTCATGSWSSVIKLWSVPDCTQVATLRGHTERISGLAWHPQADKRSSGEAALVSAGCDSLAKLWSSSGQELGELRGHASRLSRVAFHPSGRFIGTASFDTTWRLWDAERRETLLLQEGHTRPLYAIAFHPDGSLVATAGLDALLRVWDLRTGKCVQLLHGHVKQVLGLDFAPTGTSLASGSDDHTVRLWDLRKKRCAYTIPAHSALISHVKLWSTKSSATPELIKTMEGHEGRVMCGDISDDGKHFATAAMDHTWKLWGTG
ncbi:hypothetical protein EMIHUDRAFT_108000 [Emiliania huxleyi CCMP1516]|uniref:Pre-mRNA processing factor 4 (PRP4)-like domain-containing protein n=2 Tax=Emiliania huxleyi TaxID=2903 RepID=A0A0D3HXZ1_EMIH1|nr:hypothetical protein EMIHUDRAFT_108000 [Emiliania huxleyi CCMP1516]EOD03876.1 hypothetical protein EMIHUDRAFT_108000 [Emiliania huxleyi CCMP1516]|eukprot:XP_005756305.1 hypothetical protein EMIHUDRAFT_108000 [Emiliania huxleyi CCMP1516]